MRTLKKSAVLALAVLLLSGPAARLFADFESAPPNAAASTRETDLATIKKTIDIPSVRRKLDEFGLTQSEIARSLARLSNDDIHEAAGHMQSLNPENDEDHALVAAVLVIGVLVPLYPDEPKPSL